jgi:DNA-binding MarR family transcriptional regulator
MKRAPTEYLEGSSVLDEAGSALFRLGRAFARLPMRELLTTNARQHPDLSAILIVQAVEAAARAGGEVTVGRVAKELGVDPSTASRLVARSVQSGYVHGVASRVDGRARGLELSDAGRELARSAAGYQRAVFDAATSEWTDDERAAFARLFVRFADAIMAALARERTD